MSEKEEGELFKTGEISENKKTIQQITC